MPQQMHMYTLADWARRAVERGRSPGTSLGRTSSGSSGRERTWEAHGFAVDPAPLDEFKRRAGPMFKSERMALVEDVPLDQLTSAQGGVWRDKVDAIMRSDHVAPDGARDSDGYLVDHPRIIRSGGKLYVYDGNHRLESARRSGNPTWPCRVVDLDLLEPGGGPA